MFEKFGEFDSAEELNEAAEGLKNEGDIKSLLNLAEENGIDKEDAQDYADGYMDKLASPFMAAIGKLNIECKDLMPREIMVDWVEYIKATCMEQESMCVAVRKKDKSLRGCVAALLKWSFKNQIPIDKKIINEAGVSSGKVTLGIPGMGRAKEIIRKYYIGK